MSLTNDLEIGLPSGWPDEYAASVVAAVRYVRAERIHCQNDITKRDQRRRESAAKSQRSQGAGGRR